MILMASINFSTSTHGENYHTWAIKMKANLKGLNLWKVVENDVNFATLPSNSTLMQLKKYEEDLA